VEGECWDCAGWCWCRARWRGSRCQLIFYYKKLSVVQLWPLTSPSTTVSQRCSFNNNLLLLGNWLLLRLVLLLMVMLPWLLLPPLPLLSLRTPVLPFNQSPPAFFGTKCIVANEEAFCAVVEMFWTSWHCSRAYWRQWADERFGDPPLHGGSRSLQWSEIRMAVHCFCVCSGSVLLGNLLGVCRSRERDLPSVLFIYPRFLCVCSLCIVTFFVFVLFCYNLMHVRCFALVVNTCILFRLAASVLWCWSWEKEGRAVEVVAGI